MLLRDDTANRNMPSNKSSVWVGNSDWGDGAASSSQHVFYMPRTLTFTTFYCAVGTANSAGTTITFQVFDANGDPVGGGDAATCVIGTDSAWTANTSASITLTGGQLYAVKATKSTGNLQAAPAWWALG